MTAVRVLIADDNPEIRAALVDLLKTHPGLAVAGVATTTSETVALASSLRPDVALVDAKMPGGGGPQATRAICQGRLRTRVLALSAYQDRATVLEMLKAGAVGYVVKGSPADELLMAIEGAACGLPMRAPVPSASTPAARPNPRSTDA